MNRLKVTLRISVVNIIIIILKWDLVILISI